MLVKVCVLKPADHIQREDRSIAFIGTGSGNDTGFLFVPNTVGEGYHCPRSWGLAGQGFWEQWNCRTQSHNKQIFHIWKGLQTYRLPPSFKTLGNCGSERKMSLSLSCTQPMATLGLRSRSPVFHYIWKPHGSQSPTPTYLEQPLSCLLYLEKYCSCQRKYLYQ